MSDMVLVTGASGFIGGHITAGLLRRGYRVRGSVRSPRRDAQVRAAMTGAGVDDSLLEIRHLDLLSDDGWTRAADGCRFVVHVASPFTTAAPKDPAALTRPAVDGTRRAVSAGLHAGSERIVVTSSLAAIQHARAPRGHVFSASDWTDPTDRGINAYTASKTLAEQAAWALADRHGARDRIATIHPGAVVGPLLDDEIGTSVSAIQQLLSGALPMVPDLRMPWVHVTDIADAHIAAMTSQSAGGTRTIVATDPRSLIDVARIIRDRLPQAAAKIPKRSMPTWLTWAASLFEPQLRDNRWLIGANQRFDHHPAQALLGSPLRSVPDTIEETARSLTERGLT